MHRSASDIRAPSESSSPSHEARVRFWGTRGSIPSPGPTTVRYGGNTPCVEVRAGERLFILDAGTGIRPLGKQLVDSGEIVRATVLLTHFHWDHIQGLPFFYPLHHPSSQVDVFGPAANDLEVRERLQHQMAPAFFPVPLHDIRAECRFQGWTSGDRRFGDCEVRVFPLRHPSTTLGYRIDTPTASICYLPDSELVGGPFDVEADWRPRLEQFLEGADLLIHDAMIFGDEYERYEGWGHSTVEQAVELARDARVRHLVGFHHAPDRSDDEIDEKLARIRADIEDSDLEFSFAFEGDQRTFLPPDPS